MTKLSQFFNLYGINKLSFIRIEKSPFSRWRRNSKANTSLRSHRKNQTRGDKKQNKKQKTHTGMNKSASFTPVQGPSMYDSDLTITTSPLTSSVATLTWPSVGVKPNTWKSWGLGVLRDSRMFRARQQDPKHLALGCSWCHWKGLEA